MVSLLVVVFLFFLITSAGSNNEIISNDILIAHYYPCLFLPHLICIKNPIIKLYFAPYFSANIFHEQHDGEKSVNLSARECPYKNDWLILDLQSTILKMHGEKSTLT